MEIYINKNFILKFKIIILILKINNKIIFLLIS